MGRTPFCILLLLFATFLPFHAVGGDEYITISESAIIERVITAAPDTLMAMEDLGIVAADHMRSKSVFDTYLSADAGYTRDEFERKSTFFGTREDTANWNIGLSKKLPFGTGAELKWTNRRGQLFGVPIIGGRQIFPTDPNYESTVIFSAKQPLMKNFGGIVDRSVIAQAKKAFEAADLNTKYRIAEVAAHALTLYWQWILSFGYINSYTNAVSDSQHFLNITIERRRLGTAEDTDVLTAQANLINRKNGLLRAKRLNKHLEKELKIVLGYSPEIRLVPADRKPHFNHAFYQGRDEAISHALQNRWDYLAQKEDVKRLDIKVVSAKNERWPELDLMATLAANGLKTSYSDAMDSIDNPYWNVEVKFSFPLENRAARAGLKGARHEQARSLIRLKKMENDIANSITELLTRLGINKNIVANAEASVDLQRKKLVKELEKYSYGRSSSETVILYQDDRLFAEISALEAWSDYFETLMTLKLAENVLIQ